MYVGIVDVCTHVNSCVRMSICIYACVMYTFLAHCGDAQTTPWWFWGDRSCTDCSHPVSPCRSCGLKNPFNAVPWSDEGSSLLWNFPAVG